MLNNFLNIFYDVIIFLNLVPLLFGYYWWKFVPTPIRIILLGLTLSYIISILSQILTKNSINNHFLYYFMAGINFVMYALFYQKLSKYKLFLTIITVVFLASMALSIYVEGLKRYFLMPFLIIDLVFLPFSIIIFRNNLSDKAIQVLNVGILLNLCFEIAFSVVTSNLFGYFNGQIFQIIFLGISPIFILIFMGFQIYAYYLSWKQIKPSFDNLSDFQ